jgi:site-specific DNA recombinase
MKCDRVEAASQSGKPMRAVIYCRVSSKEQVSNLSLSTQEKACGEYCQRHGWAVDRIFIEQGESAKTANRTQLKNLLGFCRENRGRIHCVVVYSLSRFAREKYDHCMLRLQLQRLGITLRSATEPIDDSSAGKLMEGIVSAFAQFDNDVRSERTVHGMKARLERGGWTFPPPLGYLAQREATGQKTLVPDSERAEFVQHGFELFSSGLYSKKQVLDIITKMGLRSKTGKLVASQTFGELLRNPIYAGRMVVSDWNIRATASFPALVAPDMFDRVQRLLEGRGSSVTPRKKSNPDFPLRHFVACGRCNRPITGSWSRGRTQRYAYYRCQNRACRGVNVKREELERHFIEFLEQLKPKPEYVRLFSEIIVDVWKRKQGEAVAVHETLTCRVEELRNRKNLLVEAFVYKRQIDKSTYQEQLDKLNEEITIAELEEQDARLDGLDIEGAIEFAQHVLLNAARLWQESSPDQKQRLQQLLFPEGVAFSDDTYRTGATSCIFFELEEVLANKEGVVALTGIEPVFED